MTAIEIAWENDIIFWESNCIKRKDKGMYQNKYESNRYDSVIFLKVK